MSLHASSVNLTQAPPLTDRDPGLVYVIFPGWAMLLSWSMFTSAPTTYQALEFAHQSHAICCDGAAFRGLPVIFQLVIEHRIALNAS